MLSCAGVESWEESRPLHLEQVVAAAVEVAPEPRNGLELARVDAAGGVEDGVVDVDQEDLADDEVGGDRTVADGDDLADPALEVDGGREDAGRADFRRGRQLKAGVLSLALPAGQLLGGRVHRPGQGFDGGIQ